jgi:cysteine-rich repeat protein
MKTLIKPALGALLLLSASCTLTIDPGSVDPPAGGGGGAPVCGNGIREGLEGCDDGNTTDFDGCSASCIYELTGRPSFASVTYNGLWMSVTPLGKIYMSVSGSGGSVDSITRVDPDATVHLNVIPNIHSYYGGDVVAVGEDLVFGGYNGFTADTWVQLWTSATNTTSTLFSIGGYFQNFAVNVARDRILFADYNGPVLKVTSPTTSSAYSSTTVTRLLYAEAASKLYAISGGNLMVDSSGGSGATGTFSTLYALAGITDIAIDGEGTIYLACSTGGGTTPCTPGSIVAVNPAGTPSRPFVASSSTIRRIGYDAAANALVVVSAGNIYKVPLAR